MKRILITIGAFLLASCATPAPKSQPVVTSVPVPPSEVLVVLEYPHGVEVADRYRWLEEQEAPATREWITRQNAYTDAVLGPRPEPEAFARRLTELMNTDKIHSPLHREGRTFFMRRAVGEDQASIYLRDRRGNEERLLDPAPLSPDHTVSFGISDVTSDGKILAYSVRHGGADEVEVRFYDTDARRDIGEPLPRQRIYTVAIAPNNDVYYTRVTDAGPRVFRRSLLGGREREVFGAGYGPGKIVFNSLSEDGRFLLIHVFHGSAPKKTEIYVDDLRNADPPRVVVNDLDFRSVGELAGDSIVIQTNWNAPNDRVMVVRAEAPGRENWKEIVPQNPKAAIQSMSLAGGRVFVRYLEDVKPRIVSYDLGGRRRDEIVFETPGLLADVSGSWSSPVAFFSFSSFHVPGTIYQYDVERGERTVFSREAAPVDSDRFVVEQVWYASKDGTKIPMFLMSLEGVKRDGSNPVYLTGYGGFTQSSLPAFSPSAVAWAEQGGIYALANLRGGGEFGEAWHLAGMREKKQNTFDDFIAAAEFLVRERYTSPEHLSIAGTSNGGLLVTAAATQRPELFAAVLCRYPLIDMLRYHKFMVGSFWVPEYGNPDVGEEFGWIHAYSPYHHVKKGTKYPATLFVTGDADTRVAPLHARKMTALMQALAANGPEDPILLRYHISGGHSGGEPLNVEVRNRAEELGSLWWQTR